jgi:hypothetical protein
MPKTSRKTEAAILLEDNMHELGLAFLREFRFSYPRRWRADYAVLTWGAEVRFLVEIEGGGWIRGRHTTGSGFEADLTKYATATAMGYTVFRFSPRMILTGKAKEFLAQWLKRKEGI